MLGGGGGKTRFTNLNYHLTVLIEFSPLNRNCVVIVTILFKNKNNFQLVIF